MLINKATGGKKMTRRNMSDIIEEYLKQFLQESQRLEIKRSDIADRFDCVPSQINYVINTRFTQEHGYLVESKRGGGGYIRILKIQLTSNADEVDQMMALVGDKISYRNATNIIETLIRDDIISQREGRLMLSVIDKDLLQSISAQDQAARALILNRFLQQLKYELTQNNYGN